MKSSSAKLITSLFLLSIMTSCASSWQKYQEQTNYNLMQCAKMCSTGNVSMIAKFDCACRHNNPGNSSNKNMNSSNSSGNVIYLNSGAQNSGSQAAWMGIAGQLMQHEENRLNRLNRDLNSPNPNVVPQNNINNYYVPQNNNRQPASFGGFGGF